MADDYDSETTLAPSEEPKRNSEVSAATLNIHSQTQEEPPESSSSRFTKEVAQDLVLDPVCLPKDCGDAVSRKADSVNFGEERDETDSHALEEKVEKAGDASNGAVFLVKREGKGFEEELEKVENTCLKSAVWEKQERQGFEVENGCAVPVCMNDGVLMELQLKCGHSDNVVLGEEEPNSDTSVAVLENREKGVSGILERLEFDDKMNSWGNTSEGSLKKCSLKISVIDETALIETSEVGEGFRDRKLVKNVNYNEQENCGNRGKKPRRKGKSGKNKNLAVDGKGKNLDLCHNDCGIRMLEGFEEKRQNNVYSRKELEGLRHVELESQRKKWAEIYCGLGPVVQEEYDGLVGSDYHHQYYNQKQKKFIRVDYTGGPSIFSEGSSEKIADKEIAMENPMEFTSGLSPVNLENGCLSEQEYVEDDSDEDYSSIQRPAFSVSGEPNFDSGSPEDGLEYLRRVRWEAAHLPKVKVAKVDKSKLNKEQTNYMPQIPDVAKCPEQLMPLKEWEDAFVADFSDLRLALSHFGGSEEQLQSSVVCQEESSSKLLESNLLENFDSMSWEGDSCQSTPNSISQTHDNPHLPFVANDSDGSDSVERSGSKPSDRGASVEYPALSTIMRMDSVARVSTLRKRINRAESMSNLCRNDCLWLFALSAAVDSPLDADTCASFRSLLRKCASLRAEKLVVDEEVAMLNILATISGRYFGQQGH